MEDEETTAPPDHLRRQDEHANRVDYERANKGLYGFRIYNKPESFKALDPRRDGPFPNRIQVDASQSLSREELRDHLHELDGIPVIYEHQHRSRVGGTVVEKEMNPNDGSVDVYCRLFAHTPEGRDLIWRVETGRDGHGASLSHCFHGPSRLIKFNEVSICKKGMRDGTDYIGYRPDSTSRGLDAYCRTYRPRVPNDEFFARAERSQRAPKPRTWTPSGGAYVVNASSSTSGEQLVRVPLGNAKTIWKTRRRILPPLKRAPTDQVVLASASSMSTTSSAPAPASSSSSSTPPTTGTSSSASTPAAASVPSQTPPTTAPTSVGTVAAPSSSGSVPTHSIPVNTTPPASAAAPLASTPAATPAANTTTAAVASPSNQLLQLFTQILQNNAAAATAAPAAVIPSPSAPATTTTTTTSPSMDTSADANADAVAKLGHVSDKTIQILQKMVKDPANMALMTSPGFSELQEVIKEQQQVADLSRAQLHQMKQQTEEQKQFVRSLESRVSRADQLEMEQNKAMVKNMRSLTEMSTPEDGKTRVKELFDALEQKANAGKLEMSDMARANAEYANAVAFARYRQTQQDPIASMLHSMNNNMMAAASTHQHEVQASAGATAAGGGAPPAVAASTGLAGGAPPATPTTGAMGTPAGATPTAATTTTTTNPYEAMLTELTSRLASVEKSNADKLRQDQDFQQKLQQQLQFEQIKKQVEQMAQSRASRANTDKFIHGGNTIPINNTSRPPVPPFNGAMAALSTPSFANPLTAPAAAAAAPPASTAASTTSPYATGGGSDQMAAILQLLNNMNGAQAGGAGGGGGMPPANGGNTRMEVNASSMRVTQIPAGFWMDRRNRKEVDNRANQVSKLGKHGRSDDDGYGNYENDGNNNSAVAGAPGGADGAGGEYTVNASAGTPATEEDDGGFRNLSRDDVYGTSMGFKMPTHEELNDRTPLSRRQQRNNAMSRSATS